MIQVYQIIQLLQSHNLLLSVEGEVYSLEIKHLRPPEATDEFTLDWIGRKKANKQDLAHQSKARVIICDPEVEYTDILKQQQKILLRVKNPKLAIAIVGNAFFVQYPEQGIHPTAIIHPEAVIDSSVSIGAHCTIGKAKIDAHTIIYPNTVIYDNVRIGQNCIIHSGSVIGTDGLGCERLDDGTLIKFPHLGGVEIQDYVEIGANCQIARGALSNTIIGKGTKMNVGCYVAHNVIIEKNVWLSAQAKIAGSAHIGENSTIFIGVIVREHRNIGKNVVIGMGSVVTKDIPDNEIWIGNPARKFEKS